MSRDGELRNFEYYPGTDELSGSSVTSRDVSLPMEGIELMDEIECAMSELTAFDAEDLQEQIELTSMEISNLEGDIEKANEVIEWTMVAIAELRGEASAADHVSSPLRVSVDDTLVEERKEEKQRTVRRAQSMMETSHHSGGAALPPPSPRRRDVVKAARIEDAVPSRTESAPVSLSGAVASTASDDEMRATRPPPRASSATRNSGSSRRRSSLSASGECGPIAADAKCLVIMIVPFDTSFTDDKKRWMGSNLPGTTDVKQFGIVKDFEQWEREHRTALQQLAQNEKVRFLILSSEAPLALSEYQSFSMLQERVAYLRNCATLLHSPRVGRFLQNFKRRPRKLFFTANDDLCHAFLEFRTLDWKPYAADIKARYYSVERESENTTHCMHCRTKFGFFASVLGGKDSLRGMCHCSVRARLR